MTLAADRSTNDVNASTTIVDVRKAQRAESSGRIRGRVFQSTTAGSPGQSPRSVVAEQPSTIPARGYCIHSLRQTRTLYNSNMTSTRPEWMPRMCSSSLPTPLPIPSTPKHAAESTHDDDDDKPTPRAAVSQSTKSSGRFSVTHNQLTIIAQDSLFM